MLSHLERQPRNKERRVAWLKLIEPFLNGVGLVLLAHFGRIFPLIFQWMHADDDETVMLVRTAQFSTSLGFYSFTCYMVSLKRCYQWLNYYKTVLFILDALTVKTFFCFFL